MPDDPTRPSSAAEPVRAVDVLAAADEAWTAALDEGATPNGTADGLRLTALLAHGDSHGVTIAADGTLRPAGGAGLSPSEEQTVRRCRSWTDDTTPQPWSPVDQIRRLLAIIERLSAAAPAPSEGLAGGASYCPECTRRVTDPAGCPGCGAHFATPSEGLLSQEEEWDPRSWSDVMDDVAQALRALAASGPVAGGLDAETRAEGLRLLAEATPPWEADVPWEVESPAGRVSRIVVPSPDDPDGSPYEVAEVNYGPDAALIVWLRNHAAALLASAPSEDTGGPSTIDAALSPSPGAPETGESVHD